MKSYGLRRLKDEGDVGVVSVNMSIWIVRENGPKPELASVLGEFKDRLGGCGVIEFLHEQNIFWWSGPFEGQNIIIPGLCEC